MCYCSSLLRPSLPTSLARPYYMEVSNSPDSAHVQRALLRAGCRIASARHQRFQKLETSSRWGFPLEAAAAEAGVLALLRLRWMCGEAGSDCSCAAAKAAAKAVVTNGAITPCTGVSRHVRKHAAQISARTPQPGQAHTSSEETSYSPPPASSDPMPRSARTPGVGGCVVSGQGRLKTADFGLGVSKASAEGVAIGSRVPGRVEAEVAAIGVKGAEACDGAAVSSLSHACEKHVCKARVTGT